MLRNQAVVATLTPAGTSWTFTEPTALGAATYGYAARVADAAGNVSTAGGSTRSVVISTQFPLANAATTLSTINGVAPNANGSVPINNIASPVLAGTIQRGLIAAPPGVEIVRVYRNGTAVGTASVNGLNWSFTSASLAEGTYTFLARIEQSGSPGTFGQPSASVSDPIDLTAPGRVTVTATSNVAPSSAVSGAVPASANIVGQTNDPTPTVTIQLSAALGGDTLVIQRNGVAITPSLTQCPGVPPNTCFTFTDNPGVSIPVPTANPIITLNNTAVRPPVTNVYTARVTDAAGNVSQGSLTANFDYFVCNQVRANTTFGGTHASVASTDTPCQQCHRIFTDTSTQTPVTYVSVPQSTPTYWCRRPF